MPKPIDTVAEFYAHAIAIEREAMERYAEFAGYYADRGEEVLSGLCHNLAGLERGHLEQLLLACAHLQLPAIASTDYQWLESGPPEAMAREFFYRVANPRQLLEVALDAESRAVAFFEWARRTTGDAAVRELAREMAAEERQHVRWVRSALDYGFARVDANQRAPRPFP
jgi:rubrerythrin